MKLLSSILFLSLLLLTNSCGQEQKQMDKVGMEGIWDVSSIDDEQSFTTVWEINRNGSFCEREYVSKDKLGVECMTEGFWKLKNKKLAFELTSADYLDVQETNSVEFRVAKEGEAYSLTRLKNKADLELDLPTQNLRLTRR